MKISQLIPMHKAGKIALAALCSLSVLSACGPAPTEPSMGYASYPSAEPSAEPYYDNGLSSLLTGSIVSEEEQQLRDQLHRKVLLDFPMRVGVIFYDYDTELDPSDREDMFDNFAAGLEETGLVREAVEIPDSLIQGRPNLEQLRQLGARFQTDILILINGRHETPISHVQTDFWGQCRALYRKQNYLSGDCAGCFYRNAFKPYGCQYKKANSKN